MPSYIRRKSLINRSGIDWTDYNCNHYVGCIHNCQYPCYARKLSRKSESEWAKVAVVENAMELAARDIKRVASGSTIMVSSMTDPYQTIEATEKLTRSLIPILASKPDVTMILITKSDLVRRDFELIQAYPNVKLCMTITSCDNIPEYEPIAPGNKLRIQCLKEAYKKGIYTIASIEPWIQGISKPIHIVKKTHPFVNEYFLGSWNYHFKRQSKTRQQVRRMYNLWTPVIVKEVHNHLKTIFVKKELAQLLTEETHRRLVWLWHGKTKTSNG